jgi:RNA polymerase-binding protein DksA
MARKTAASKSKAKKPAKKPAKKSAQKPAKKAAKKPAAKSAKKAAPKKATAKKKPAAAKKAVKKTAKKTVKKAAKTPAKKSAPKKSAAKKPAKKAAKKSHPKKATGKATRKATVKKTTKAAAKKAPAKKGAKKAAPKKTAAKTAAKKAPAKKSATKKATAKKAPAKKAPVKKAATKKAAPKKAAPKSAAKSTSTSATTAKAPKKVTFERSATNIPNKGVLIRLKRTGKDYDHAGRQKLRTVAAVEKSSGVEPINLHHRKPTSKELETFRQLLIERRALLMGTVKDLEGHAFSEEAAQVSTNHLADSSTDQYEQEFTLSIMENETEELKEIARALEKIDGGTYGECEACGIDISIERLTAMPYTRICIHCRSKFEEEGGGEEYGVFPETRV